MQEKRFHREDYPLNILAEFGLSEEMIYDLPDFVHETIEMGGKSPLLPITIQQPFGETRLHAKFCLFETENGMDVLFFPKLKSINLDTALSFKNSSPYQKQHYFIARIRAGFSLVLHFSLLGLTD